jgi:phosphatidylglycerol---prolipoprotein diacylglyceryl transferase
MSNPINDAAWFHRLDPTLLDLGFMQIKWYGVSYLAGFFVAGVLLYLLARHRRILMPPHNALDAVLVFVAGVVLGGRLGYCLFYDPELFISFTSSFPYWGVLAIQRGGMASHGAMIGVLAAAWWISRGFRQEDGAILGRSPMLHVADLSCLVAAPGLFFGRLANFVNGELLGRVVAAPGEPAPWWAVRYPQELVSKHTLTLSVDQQDRLLALVDEVRRPGETDGEGLDRLLFMIRTESTAAANSLAARLEPLISARHPSQLYQAAAEGLVVGGLLWLIWARPQRPGVITAAFLILYGILRILVEQYWRLPDPQLKTQYILGLTRGQLLSVGMLAAGSALLAFAVRRPGPRFSWRRSIVLND